MLIAIETFEGFAKGFHLKVFALGLNHLDACNPSIAEIEHSFIADRKLVSQAASMMELSPLHPWRFYRVENNLHLYFDQPNRKFGCFKISFSKLFVFLKLLGWPEVLTDRI